MVDLASYGLEPIDDSTHSESNLSKYGLESIESKPDNADSLPSPYQFNPYASELGLPDYTQPKKRKQTYDVLEGAGKGYVNSLANMANLLPGVNLPNIQYDKSNPYTQEGAIGGDIASYFFPSFGAKLAVKGLEHLPVANKLIQAGRDVINKNALTRWLASNIGAGAEAGIYSASHADKGNKLKSGGLGYGIGSAVNALDSMLGSKYKLLGKAAGAALGGAIGNEYGHPWYGAGIGAAALPLLKPALVGSNTLEKADQAFGDLYDYPQFRKNINQSLNASDNIGVTPRPGQAAASTVTSAQEGNLIRNTGHLGEIQDINQIKDQSKATQNALRNLYNPTPANENNINSLYQRAFQHSISENHLNRIKENPLWREAINKASRDNSLLADMRRNGVTRLDKNGNEIVDDTNYQFLDSVKTKMDDMYQSAINKGDLNKARRIKNEKANYLSRLDNINPDYAAARAAAHPKMVRAELESRINQNEEDQTGKNVYKALFGNRKKAADTLRSLKAFPDAQREFRDLGRAFREYGNRQNSAGAKFQGEKNLDKMRNGLGALTEFLDKYVSGKSNRDMVKFVHSPEWIKAYRDYDKLRDNKARIAALRGLISKFGVAYGLSGSDSDHLSNLLLEDDEKSK